MNRKVPVRFGGGEKMEITSKSYLFLCCMLTRDIPLETAQSRRRWATIFGILAMDQTDCYFGINNIKLTIVVQLTAYSFVSGHP